MQMHFKKVLIALFLLSFLSISNATVTKEVENDLATLSKHFTERFLKNSYSQSDVYNTLIYLKNNTHFAIYVYTFRNNTWTMKPLMPRVDISTHAAWSRLLLSWLNQNATKNIKEGFTFVHLPQEPLHEDSQIDRESHIKVDQLFERCPILATCTHPKILWSQNAVLIPDPFILNENYVANVRKITDAKLDTLKNRKSDVFFRGAVSGHNNIFYDIEDLSKDDRLRLFLMSKNKSFIDAKITSTCWLEDKKNVSPDFQEWYLKNLADKKGPYADFIEHAHHKYLISIDGFGAAWSRVQYILFTGSVLLLRADCTQYFYPLLTPMKTHVEINQGLTNLEETYTYLEQNPTVAQAIADNGRIFAEKYLTKDAIDTYLTHVIYDLNEAYHEPLGWHEKLSLIFQQVTLHYVSLKYELMWYYNEFIKTYFMNEIS